jgi:hypothetical protein
MLVYILYELNESVFHFILLLIYLRFNLLSNVLNTLTYNSKKRINII